MTDTSDVTDLTVRAGSLARYGPLGTLVETIRKQIAHWEAEESRAKATLQAARQILPGLRAGLDELAAPSLEIHDRLAAEEKVRLLIGDWEAGRFFRQTDIAEGIFEACGVGINRSTLRSALLGLVELGVLRVKSPGRGRRGTVFEICPAVAWHDPAGESPFAQRDGRLRESLKSFTAESAEEERARRSRLAYLEQEIAAMEAAGAEAGSSAGVAKG